MKSDKQLGQLLNLVIENYIEKGDPIGSKFLHTMGEVEYAPSTLRKYLNILEKEWLVYQTYNSSGRVPTLTAMENYIDELMTTELISSLVSSQTALAEIQTTRQWLRFVVEHLGSFADGVVIGFLRNDQYYFMGINNLIKDNITDIDMTKSIISFVESKRIIGFLDESMMKNSQIYHTFVPYEWEKVLSAMYVKLHFNEYDSVICIIWPIRTNYRKNLEILQDFIQKTQTPPKTSWKKKSY